MTLLGLPGTTYTLERSHNLEESTPVEGESVRAGADGIVRLQDLLPPWAAFYRAVGH